MRRRGLSRRRSFAARSCTCNRLAGCPVSLRGFLISPFLSTRNWTVLWVELLSLARLSPFRELLIEVRDTLFGDPLDSTAVAAALIGLSGDSCCVENLLQTCRR